MLFVSDAYIQEIDSFSDISENKVVNKESYESLSVFFKSPTSGHSS